MNKKIGFIGAGKMANAIMGGIFTSGLVENFYFSEPNDNVAQKIVKTYNATRLKTNIEVVENSDVIIFCVKPFILLDVIKETESKINSSKLIISIAAGVSTQTIENTIQKEAKVIRVMSNTPALVKEGASAICKGKYAEEDDVKIAKVLMKSVGEIVEIEESKIDIITALSGSGPAFYYYLIDKMAKSASKFGLNSNIAIKLSAQTALGAAKMILAQNDDFNISQLIENVTTKGGCTEVGNICLKNSDIENVLDETIRKTMEKAIELGKQK